MTADDSKKENLVTEVGHCVKGSRIRNPVPPPAAVEDVLLEVLEKLESVVRWGTVSKFSEGRSRFYPGGFSKTENIRIVRVDKI